MFLLSIKEINRSINKGMSNIHLISCYWEKLTLSKLRLCNFKKFFSWRVFWWASTHTDTISRCNLKIRVLGKKNLERHIYVLFLSHFALNRTVLCFFIEKTLLNITHDKKWISKFPQVLWPYVTRLSHFEKILIIESGVHRSSYWANSWQIF